MRELIIGKNEASQRMDKYLKKYLREAGTGFLYKMLRKKNIVLNGKKAEGSEILREGDSIKLYLSEETIEKFRGECKDLTVDFPKQDARLQIVYEDENFLIVNKPAGILSQKASPKDVSMVEMVIRYLLESKQLTKEELQTFHPSVCNRLDRNTSGLLLAGKTLAGLQEFSRILKERQMKKYYLCLVRGKIEKPQHCKAYLKKDSKTNQVKILNYKAEDAEYIETAYEPIWNCAAMTLLKVDLITGKSHQIRSHLSSLGYPLLGDPKYGDAAFNREWKKRTGLSRQFLHAFRIEFPEQSGILHALSQREIEAELPEDLRVVLQEVGYLTWKGV